MTNNYDSDIDIIEKIISMIRKEVVLVKRKRKKPPIIILPQSRIKKHGVNSAGSFQPDISNIFYRIKETIIWKSLERFNNILRKNTIYEQYYIAVRNRIMRLFLL